MEYNTNDGWRDVVGMEGTAWVYMEDEEPKLVAVDSVYAYHNPYPTYYNEVRAALVAMTEWPLALDGWRAATIGLATSVVMADVKVATFKRNWS